MMEKTKIFGIGISGLVGTRIAEVLKENYIFDNLSLDTGVDITNPATLDVIRKDTEHPIVLHLAAKADVDGCEKDKELGEEGAAYKINVGGTQNIVNACKDGNKKIIYISTDFVFDGENTPAAGYTEEDTPHPINWYGETKYKGEEVVRNANIPYIITRIAYPYRQDSFPLKKDFVHAMLGRLQNNQPIIGVTDHLMTPTFLDDIALALGKLIESKAEGIYHVVGSQSLSPYDAAMLIAQKFNCDTSLIGQTTRAEFFKDKAPRPQNLTLNNQKIKQLGITMKTFVEGLDFVK
jgi:dTDP-4-dehydrorhamnose reductase